MIEVTPFASTDIDEAVELLRLEDQSAAEVDVREAVMTQFFKGSEMHTARKDGKVLAIWGFNTASLLSQQVYVWMLTTKAADQYPTQVAAESLRQVNLLFQRYSVVAGTCVSTHRRSMRWLEWLGATFGEVVDIGQLRHRPFEIRRN